MANALAAFDGVQASTDSQKAALGKMIAAQGSAGVESYKNQQKVAAAAIGPARASVTDANPGIGDPSMSSAVGPGELTSMLASRASQPATLGYSQAGQAANEFGSYSNLLGQANSNYMDAVSAAAPLVQSQTAAQIAAINAKTQADQRDRQKALGWDRNRLKDVTSGTTAYSNVLAAVHKDILGLGPMAHGPDSTVVRSMIQGEIAAYQKANPTVKVRAHDIENLIAVQYRGLRGEDVGTPPTPAARASAREQAAGTAGMLGGMRQVFGTAKTAEGKKVVLPKGATKAGRFVGPLDTSRLRFGLNDAGSISDHRLRMLATSPGVALNDSEKGVLRAELHARGLDR
jgi:Ni/Co efflux regulator RcnB